MKFKNKKIKIATIVICSLAIISTGAYLISRIFINNNQYEKLEDKLIIGTYKETKSTTNEKSFNRLYIEIVNNGDVVEKMTYETNDETLSINNKYPECVFVDLSETIKPYINNQGIYSWSLNNTNKNYINVRTEVILGGYISSNIKLVDSGLYLVNVPTANDEVPEVAHTYVYQKYKVGW